MVIGDVSVPCRTPGLYYLLGDLAAVMRNQVRHFATRKQAAFNAPQYDKCGHAAAQDSGVHRNRGKRQFGGDLSDTLKEFNHIFIKCDKTAVNITQLLTHYLARRDRAIFMAGGTRNVQVRAVPAQSLATLQPCIPIWLMW